MSVNIKSKIFYDLLNKAIYSNRVEYLSFIKLYLCCGFFTGPNQDDRMNMTKIGEHAQKVDNDEH